jgi:SOS response regulatory protein OraA/RecX
MDNYQQNQQKGIGKMLKLMHTYQRKEGIKGQCLANTQYLHNCYEASCPWMKTKAIAVIAHREIYTEREIDGKMQVEIVQYIITHVVLQLNKTQLIDPSAEVNDQDMTYIAYNIPTFLKRLKTKGISETEIKKILTEYLALMKCANRINAGEIIVADKAFYDAQADYIEQQHTELRNQ